MLYSQAMILMRSCRLRFLAIAFVDGCYLYIIIHNCILHVLPDCKGWSALIWQVDTKRSNNKISQILLVQVIL